MATVTLNRYSAGETGYVAKFNTDNTLIEAAFDSLAAGGDVGGDINNTAAIMTEIWPTDGIIGAGSAFRVSTGTNTLTVDSGAGFIFAVARRGRSTSTVTLNFAGKSSGIYAIILNTAGGLSISAASASVTGSTMQLYTIEYKATGFGTASQSVSTLFHGFDYARMLSSVTLGKFSQVADRLSAIETGQGTLDLLYAQSGVSGAGWDFRNGQLRDNNAIISTTAAVVSLEATQTHYIEVAISNGSVSYATAGWTSSEAIPIRFIQTAAGAVTSNADVRTWATVGGGGGGIAGLANSGTTDGLWQLYRATGAGSAPVSDASLTVDRGSQANVEIRYNETDDVWQYTNDGTNYFEFGAVGGSAFNAGQGRQTRFNILNSAPEIVAVTGQTTFSAPVELGLSAHISTTTVAVVIRGTAFDSAMSALGTSAEPFPGIAFYQSSSFQTNDAAAKVYAEWRDGYPERPQTVVVPTSGQTLEYNIWAASDLSMRASAYLIGYWDLIQGVGTQLVSATLVSITGAVSTTDTNLSTGTFSAVGNRVHVFYLQISSTIGAGSLYDLEFYQTSSRAAGDLLFQALNIDASAAYTTRLPWVYRDTASTTEVHMRISNAGASAGLFSLEWHGEKFA